MTIDAPSPPTAQSTFVEIDNLHQEIETLAQSGRWTDMATIMKRRDESLARVPEAERAMTFGAAVRFNERMLKLVQADRQAVAERLSSLRRSGEIARRYESYSGSRDAADS